MSAPIAFASLPRPQFTDPRRTSIELHVHLRRLIIDSVLPPGSVLKQAELARLFDISRTPMREAFRMLQEEGLIEADLNQKARVKALDPDELDQLYGARIALEALGARITAGRLTDLETTAAERRLEVMNEAKNDGDTDTWVTAHRKFHGLCVARASDPLLRVIISYSERSERYVRLYQLWHPQSFEAAHDEHQDILHAVCDGDVALAGSRMARHLAHTGLTVLQDVSNGAAGIAINEALAMATNSKRQRARRENPLV